MNIYKPNGDILINDVPILEAAKHVQELSKADYIALSWSDVKYTALPIGAYIMPFEGDDTKYSILKEYKPTMKDELEYVYAPEFQHPIMMLGYTPCIFKTTSSDGLGTEVNETDWSYTGNLTTIATKVVDIIEEQTGEAFEYVFITGSSVLASATVTFASVDILSALNAVAQAFETEFCIDWDNKKVYFGTISLGTAVTLEEGVDTGVASVSASTEKGANYYIVRGGTRNITRQTESGDNIETTERLAIEDIDTRTDNNAPELKKILVFDEIYPKLDLYVYNVRVRTRRLQDENNKYVVSEYNADGSVKTYQKYGIYYCRLAYKHNGSWEDFAAPKSTIVSGKKLMASFEPNEGNEHSALAGREFAMTYHETAQSIAANEAIEDSGINILAGDYEINFESEGNIRIPDIGTLQPYGEQTPSESGDKVVLYNIVMDAAYIATAQESLLQAANKEIARLASDLNNYTLKLYPKDGQSALSIGQAINYKARSGYTLRTRVIKLTTNLDYNSIVEVTVGNNEVKSTTQTLKEEVKSANNDVSTMSALNDAVSNMTSSLANAQNSMLEAMAKFKDMWQFDSEGNLYSEYNVYSKQGLSAKGFGTSGGSGNGDTIEWEQIINEGTCIARVSINGESVNVYAPNGGGGGTVNNWSDIADRPSWLDNYLGSTAPDLAIFGNEAGYLKSNAIDGMLTSSNYDSTLKSVYAPLTHGTHVTVDTCVTSVGSQTGAITVRGGLTTDGAVNLTMSEKQIQASIVGLKALAFKDSLDKSDVGLGNVENTALSSWSGSAKITTLGTITSGTWQGTAIADNYISSADSWNAKYDKPAGGIPNSDLANSSMTLWGNNVALGGSTNGSLTLINGGHQVVISVDGDGNLKVSSDGADGVANLYTTGGLSALQYGASTPDLVVNFSDLQDVEQPTSTDKKAWGWNGSSYGWIDALDNNSNPLTGSHTIWGKTYLNNGTLQDVEGEMSGVTSIDSLLFLDSVNKRLGIGVSSPIYNLDVNGTFRASNYITVGNETKIVGNQTVPAQHTAIHSDGIEMYHNTLPHIDFHYSNDSSDYSARLGCPADNVLRIYGKNDANVALQIGSARLKYDSTNNALYVEKSDGTLCHFYATGGLSAKGFGLSDSEGNGGDYLPLSGGTLSGNLGLDGHSIYDVESIEGCGDNDTVYFSSHIECWEYGFYDYANGIDGMGSGDTYFVMGNGRLKAVSELLGNNCLLKSGGTMDGSINMGNNDIDNVGDISVNGVATFDDNVNAYGDIDLHGNSLANVSEIGVDGNFVHIDGALYCASDGFWDKDANKQGTSSQVVLGDGTLKALSEITAIADADTLDGEHADGFVRAGAINSGTLNSLGDKSFIKSVNTSGDDAPYSYNDWYHCIQMAHRNGYADGADYVGQILVGMLYHPSEMWFRGSRNGKWVSVVSSANIGYQTVNSIRDNSYHDIEHRRGTANNVFADGSLRYYLATSTMSSATGKPKSDAHILHCSWDNGNWDSQLALLNSGGGIQFRGQYRKSDDTFAWSDWKDVITSDHLSVDDSGNIGIGTTPEYKLDVNGTTRTTNLIVTDTLSYDNLTVSGVITTPKIVATENVLNISANSVKGINALEVTQIKSTGVLTVGSGGSSISEIKLVTSGSYNYLYFTINGNVYKVTATKLNQ